MFPLIPICSILMSIVGCQTVSKAFDMSMNIAIEWFFCNLSIMMLSVSLFVASVVDRLGLNPCCSGGSRLFVSMWCVSLLFTIVSSIFARVGSREIGLYELGCVWSLSGFGIGIMLA